MTTLPRDILFISGILLSPYLLITPYEMLRIIIECQITSKLLNIVKEIMSFLANGSCSANNSYFCMRWMAGFRMDMTSSVSQFSMNLCGQCWILFGN